MMDSPLWLIWAGMLAGGAVAGFFARRLRPRAPASAFVAMSDAELVALYQVLLQTVVQDEHGLLIHVHAEVVRRGLVIHRSSGQPRSPKA
jgi:hypothetical protein